MYLLYFVKFQNVWARDSKTNAKLTKLLHLENCMRDQVDTRSCFNISATLYRDRIDVETMSCNYKESWKTYITRVKVNWITKHRMLPQQKLVMCTQLIHKYWMLQLLEEDCATSMEATVFLYFSLSIAELWKKYFWICILFILGELNSVKRNNSQVSYADYSILPLLHSRIKSSD